MFVSLILLELLIPSCWLPNCSNSWLHCRSYQWQVVRRSHYLGRDSLQSITASSSLSIDIRTSNRRMAFYCSLKTWRPKDYNVWDSNPEFQQWWHPGNAVCAHYLWSSHRMVWFPGRDNIIFWLSLIKLLVNMLEGLYRFLQFDENAEVAPSVLRKPKAICNLCIINT